MMRFEISATPLHLKVASYLEQAYDAKIKIERKIIVAINKNLYGLKLSKLEMGSAIPDLTDNDWRFLGSEIRQTLRGGKIRELTNWIIDIEPLRTRRIYVRLTPFEEEEIKEAAKVEKKTISDFIRGKVFQGIVETENNESILRRALERKRQQNAKFGDEQME
ncbi:MAG: DUF1778 domain-containing protein, partial [Nitrososphaerales archaeon]